MEGEEFYHGGVLDQPSYIHECILETTFSSTMQDDLFPNDVDMERLLQIETDLLLDFDIIDQCDTVGPEIIITQQIQEEKNVDSYVSAGGLIQDELMEEDNSSRSSRNRSRSSLTHLLLAGAEAVEAQNWPRASAAVDRLSNFLLLDRENENGDDHFNRLAFFFTQGLLYKTINIKNPSDEFFLREPVSSKQQTNANSTTMSAIQILQELSPYFKFVHFTANQAILDATSGDKEVHVIDFDIMEGIQWPPLMIDLAARDVSLRITAMVCAEEQTSGTTQTGRRLREFAVSINLPFAFDQTVMAKEEDFERIELGGDGHSSTSSSVIANCMTNQLHMPQRGFSLVKTFLRGVTKLSPKAVVLVEEELFSLAKIPYMSFVEFFYEALHHYTALSDSLMTSGFCGEYKLAVRVIEEEFLGMRILDSVMEFPCERKQRELWGDHDRYDSTLNGFKKIQMSACNVSQARYLVSLFSGGYWVQHEECRLVLCWKSRPLTSASVWMPSQHQSQGLLPRSTSF